MNRRTFLAAASALFLPYEPERVYSFAESVGRIERPPFFGVDRTVEPTRLRDLGLEGEWNVTFRNGVMVLERWDMPQGATEFRVEVDLPSWTALQSLGAADYIFRGDNL